MAGLEHIEIKPGLVMEPGGGLRSSERVVGDEMVRIKLAQRLAHFAPDSGLAIALRIAAGNPDDVRAVSISLRQPSRIRHYVLLIQPPAARNRSPGRHHPDIKAFLGCLANDPIDVVPVIILSGSEVWPGRILFNQRGA